MGMARKGTGNKEDSEQTDSVNSENASPNGLKTKLSPGNCFLHDYFHFDLTVQSLTMHLQNINHLCSYFALLIFMYAPYKSCRNNDVSNSEITKNRNHWVVQTRWSLTQHSRALCVTHTLSLVAEHKELRLPVLQGA